MTNTSANLSGVRCAVLGAGGFIGTNLCRALLGQADTIRAFGRRHSFHGVLRDLNWMTGDFTDPSCLAEAVAGCEVVFHLVSTTTPASANVDKVADLNANVVSTLHLLDACRTAGVRRVVFVSSGGTIYGITNSVPTPETAPANPITAYGISKLTIEKYLGLYEHLYGLEYRVLRVANPFGPYQTASKNQGAIAAFLRCALAGKAIEMWGDGSVTRDYIYIDDVVEALMLVAIHVGPNRIFNIGSAVGRSLNDIVAAINGLLGADIPVVRGPARSVDIPVSILDTGLAADELGWRARTPFEEGLRTTVAWIKSTLVP